MLIKARQDEDDDADGTNMFPTGIENEVVFMEITGKTLQNLYSSCKVSFQAQNSLGRQFWRLWRFW